MDKAPDFGSGDCRFESCHDRFFNHLCFEKYKRTRLAVNRVKPCFTKMINLSSSNTMIQNGNLDMGHLIDTLTFSWIM